MIFNVANLLGGFGSGGGSDDPTLTTCSFICRHSDLSRVEGVEFTFTLVDPLASTDAWSQELIQTATSDSGGLVSIDLPVSQRWRLRGPDGRFLDFTTGSDTTSSLPPYVGTFNGL